MPHTIHTGDVTAVLPTLPADSFDGVFCDPPYGLSQYTKTDVEKCLAAWAAGAEYDHGKAGFMGKKWDSIVPGPAVWREVFRVLKPGARLAAFAGTRTQDLMALAIELAGFEYETTLLYSFGSGFPKAQDIGKHLDAQAGAEREKLGTKHELLGHGLKGHGSVLHPDRNRPYLDNPDADAHWVTAPATEAAKLWDGYKTPALKPAYEPLLVFRKPGDDVSNPTITQTLFYGSKASTRERNAGLAEFAARSGAELTGRADGSAGLLMAGGKANPYAGTSGDGYRNTHPTLKSIALCKSMAQALFQHGGSVLVPFSGSGSEMIALLQAGFAHAEGIEQAGEYAEIARARLGHHLAVGNNI